VGKPNSLNLFKTDNNLSLEVYLTDVINTLLDKYLFLTDKTAQLITGNVY